MFLLNVVVVAVALKDWLCRRGLAEGAVLEGSFVVDPQLLLRSVSIVSGFAVYVACPRSAGYLASGLFAILVLVSSRFVLFC